MKDTDKKECTVCESELEVRFVEIADCFLCSKCDQKLAESIEYVMCQDRSDEIEL